MELGNVILGLFELTRKYLVTLFAALVMPWRLYWDVEYQITEKYLDPRVFFFIGYLALVWEYYSFVVSLRIADTTSILDAINESVEGATYFQKLVYFIPLFVITYLILALMVRALRFSKPEKSKFEAFLYYALGAYFVWYLLLYLGGLEIVEKCFHTSVDGRSPRVISLPEKDWDPATTFFNVLVITGLLLYIAMIARAIFLRSRGNLAVFLKRMAIPGCMVFALYGVQEVIDLERATFKIDENEVLVKGANGGSSSHGLLECQEHDGQVEVTLSLALINKRRSAVYLDSRSSLTMRLMSDDFFRAYINNTDLFDTVQFNRARDSIQIFPIDASLFKDSGILVVRPGDIRFVKFTVTLDSTTERRIFALKSYDSMFIYLPVDIPLNTERKFYVDHARGIVPVFTCQ